MVDQKKCAKDINPKGVRTQINMMFQGQVQIEEIWPSKEGYEDALVHYRIHHVDVIVRNSQIEIEFEDIREEKGVYARKYASNHLRWFIRDEMERRVAAWEC